MALDTLRCCYDATLPEQRSASRAIHTINPPKKCICLLVAHSFDMPARVQGLIWGARGAFPPAAAMVVMVVMLVSCVSI
jgi:hypothetical protein